MGTDPENNTKFHVRTEFCLKIPHSLVVLSIMKINTASRHSD
jgi:hypothetical protein